MADRCTCDPCVDDFDQDWNKRCAYCAAAIEQTANGPVYGCDSDCPEPSFH